MRRRPSPGVSIERTVVAHHPGQRRQVFLRCGSRAVTTRRSPCGMARIWRRNSCAKPSAQLSVPASNLWVLVTSSSWSSMARNPEHSRSIAATAALGRCPGTGAVRPPPIGPGCAAGTGTGPMAGRRAVRCERSGPRAPRRRRTIGGNGGHLGRTLALALSARGQVAQTSVAGQRRQDAVVVSGDDGRHEALCCSAVARVGAAVVHRQPGNSDARTSRLDCHAGCLPLSGWFAGTRGTARVGVVRGSPYRSSGSRVPSRPCCRANNVAVERVVAPVLA